MQINDNPPMTYKYTKAANDEAAYGADPLDAVIAEASDWLAARQKEDGHWVFELEADAHSVRIHSAQPLSRHHR